MISDPEPKILHSKVIHPGAEEKKNKRQWILLGVLSVIFIYLIFNTLFKGGKKNPKLAISQNEIVSIQKSPGKTIARDEAVTKKEEEWGRSPFSLHPEKETGALGLQGIVQDGETAYAILNEKIVKAGDWVDDKEVKEISQGKVVLKARNGQITVLNI